MSSEAVSVAEYHAELAKAMPESELQASVEAMLDQFGWRWYHHNDKGNKILAKMRRWYAMSRGKGFPDIVAVRGGVCLIIELKTEDGSLGAEQRAWRDEIQAVQEALWWATVSNPNLPIQYILWRPRHLLDGTIERTLR